MRVGWFCSTTQGKYWVHINLGLKTNLKNGIVLPITSIIERIKANTYKVTLLPPDCDRIATICIGVLGRENGSDFTFSRVWKFNIICECCKSLKK